MAFSISGTGETSHLLPPRGSVFIYISDIWDERDRQTEGKKKEKFFASNLSSSRFRYISVHSYRWRAEKRLAHNILETFATHAPLMMLLIPTARHKIAALMFAFQWLSTINLLTKRMRNQVKKCCMSIFHSIPIYVKAHDASLVWSP